MAQTMGTNLGDVVLPFEIEIRSGQTSLGVAAIEGLRMADAVALVVATIAAVTERVRQLTDKGMTSAIDALYTNGQLAQGAQAYLDAALALNRGDRPDDGTAVAWPVGWRTDMFKPWDSDGGGILADQLRCLDKATAMIMAERQRVAAVKADEAACADQERRDSGR